MPNKLATLFYLAPCLHGLYRIFYFENLLFSLKRDFDESTIDQIHRPPCFTTPPHVYTIFMGELLGHSGDFGNATKMVGKMSKSVMQLISIGF